MTRNEHHQSAPSYPTPSGWSRHASRHPAGQSILTARRPGISTGELLWRARVAVVDDSRRDAARIASILGGVGVAAVETSNDPRAGLERILRDPPDVVVLDLHMPDLDGYEVLQVLRERLAPDVFVPVLVLTGDTAPSSRERALDAGANDFMIKPGHEVELVQRIRNLLALAHRYETLQQHNHALRAELDASTAAVRRVVEEVDRRRSYLLDTIARRAIAPVYQPIVDLHEGHVVGYEALARFPGPPHRTAAAWFDDAAELGVAVELERAAIDVALRGLSKLPSDAFLSVNASPASVVAGEVLDAVRGVPGERIVVELTEHTRVDDHDQVRRAVDELRAQGIRVAIDDVGAGYAGLQWILRLRPDIIKLDLELPRGIDGDPIRRALAAALVVFGAESGSRIIAEGIETGAELAALAGVGVRWGQGHHLGRPGPLS